MSEIIEVYSYFVDDRYKYNDSISCSKDISVKGFLDELKKILKRRHDKNGTRMLKDIHCVYLKDKKLDEHSEKLFR